MIVVVLRALGVVSDGRWSMADDNDVFILNVAVVFSLSSIDDHQFFSHSSLVGGHFSPPSFFHYNHSNDDHHHWLPYPTKRKKRKIQVQDHTRIIFIRYFLIWISHNHHQQQHHHFRNIFNSYIIIGHHWWWWSSSC